MKKGSGKKKKKKEEKKYDEETGGRGIAVTPSYLLGSASLDKSSGGVGCYRLDSKAIDGRLRG
jgi:hypothetical protein